MQARVDYIRESLLPKYLSIPTAAPSAPRQSRLPQPSIFRKNTELHSIPPTSKPKNIARPHSPPADDTNDTQNTPRRLVTSTPPPTVKPRSTHTRRIIGSHHGERSPKKGKVEFSVSSSGGLRKARKSVRKSVVFSRPSLFGPAISYDENDSENDYEHDVGRVSFPVICLRCILALILGQRSSTL